MIRLFILSHTPVLLPTPLVHLFLLNMFVLLVVEEEVIEIMQVVAALDSILLEQQHVPQAL
tara:strand:- start:460 stop:642 length:183 start_codon:yes stop_codon:yes gene_type:complete